MQLKNDFIFSKWSSSLFIKRIDDVKHLRKLYSAYPYLYAYDEEYETIYLQNYVKMLDDLDVFSICLDKNLIGVSIGCPLTKEIEISNDIFNANINTDNAYYFGDIIIDRHYTRQGLADMLYSRHIEYVKNKSFHKIFALLINRDADDSRKPENFKSSKLWENHGFIKTKFKANYKWKTIQINKKTEEENNEMSVYEKILY